MRSLAVLGLLVVFLCSLDNTESLLFYYHRPRPVSIEPPADRATQTAPQRAGRRYDLVPFLKALKASNQVDWEEWKDWLYDIGILQPVRPKLKDLRL